MRNLDLRSVLRVQQGLYPHSTRAPARLANQDGMRQLEVRIVYLARLARLQIQPEAHAFLVRPASMHPVIPSVCLVPMVQLQMYRKAHVSPANLVGMQSAVRLCVPLARLALCPTLVSVGVHLASQVGMLQVERRTVLPVPVVRFLMTMPVAVCNVHVESMRCQVMLCVQFARRVQYLLPKTALV